jgi:hypothetical protein
MTHEVASFDVGRYVECDFCGAVLTDDIRTGGLIFSGKGAGPCCADRVMTTIQQYGEEQYIQGRCTPGMAFADWIREVRAQTPHGNEVRIIGGLFEDGGAS